MKMSFFRAEYRRVGGGLLVWLTFAVLANGAELQVGTASVDITPNKAVALWGQFGLRLSTKPDTPLTANVVALQSAEAQTTLVSLDLLQLPEVFVQAVREAVAKKDAAIDVRNMVLTATHTHTAPVLRPGTPGIPVNDQTMTVEETIAFLSDRISDGIVAAWKNLAPGKMSYGLDRNSIGFGRRAVYADGSAQMYGGTDRPDFVNLEGMDDDDVGSIFFYDGQDKLKAIAVNVACPSQVVEGQSSVNADFWLPVRNKLKARYGEGLVVLGWGAAAGDMSPRPLLHKAANAGHAGAPRHRRDAGTGPTDRFIGQPDIRGGPTGEACRADSETLRDHAAVAVEQDFRVAVPASAGGVQQHHRPGREGPELCSSSRVHGQRLASRSGATLRTATEGSGRDVPRRDTRRPDRRRGDLLQSLRAVLRVRHPHQGTFQSNANVHPADVRVWQLSADRAAQAAGSYSAIPQSNIIGPAGGQMLVDKTVGIIDELWK